MECVGAIDQGTQSTRFVLYDRKGLTVASHQVEFEQITPRAGCALRRCVATPLPETLTKPLGITGPVKLRGANVQGMLQAWRGSPRGNTLPHRREACCFAPLSPVMAALSTDAPMPPISHSVLSAACDKHAALPFGLGHVGGRPCCSLGWQGAAARWSLSKKTALSRLTCPFRRHDDVDLRCPPHDQVGRA